MKIAFIAFIAATATLAACASLTPPSETQVRTPQALVEQLLEADRAFALASEQAGGLSVFTGMFDESVAMFAVPVPGFAHGRAQAIDVLGRALGGSTGRTGWAPIRGGISADGQHGFTFGYMTTREGTQPPRLGKYVSYWIRRRDGWRVVLFKRVPMAGGEVSLALMPPSVPAGLVPNSSDTAALAAFRESLMRRELEFSDEAQRIGLGPAFSRFGSADAVNVGGGPEFVVGAHNIAATLPPGPGSPFSWAADGGVLVASSGDLGVTWGFLRRNQPPPPGRLATIPFFTIWRRASPADPWLYIAE